MRGKWLLLSAVFYCTPALGQGQVYAPTDPRAAAQEAAEAKAKADAADQRAQDAADLARAAMNVANAARTRANEAALAASTTPGPAGADGTNGHDGANGGTPTLSVSGTTTLPPGSPATVTMGGTQISPTLAFGVPQGAVSTVPGPAATVALGAVTTSAPGGAGSVTNTGTPSAAIFNFTLPRPLDGVNGTNGAAGQAATVAIGTVTTGTPGSAASVTNSGTSSAAVFNMTLPRGDTGATFLANVTIAQTAGVALPLGPRLVTVPLTGCLAGERILLTPLAALPTGYGILDASCFTAGVLTVNIYGPALIIGGSYSITAKTTVFR